MKINIDIKTDEDIRDIRQAITTLRLELHAFQAVTIRKLANMIIVDTIHKRMREANFSEKIIINTILANIEFISKDTIELHFVSTLFSDSGFDVALAREKGTKDHLVRSKDNRKNAHLKWIESGKVLFSKENHVKGIKALHIIGKTVDELTTTLQLKYNQELVQWMEYNMKRFTANAI